MSLTHLLTWRRLSLLAADCLDGPERERALWHVAACERCALELGSLQGVLHSIEADPARTAEPGIPIEALVQATRARADRVLRAPGLPRNEAPPWEPRRAGLLWVPLAAAAAFSALVLAPRWAPPVFERVPSMGDSAGQGPSRVAIDEPALRRLERRVAREQAARYLSDAEDVLVTLAAVPQQCDRERGTLDLALETQRSQALLQRRALLLDFDSADVRSARPLLEDVEGVLRDVALLDPCARPERLLAIHDRLREGRLLMKIGLLTRELQG